MIKQRKLNKAPAPKAVVKTKAQTFKSLRPPPSGASPAGWHKVESYFHCPKKFQLKEVWGLRRPAYITPDPLAIGQLFHVGRAWWFDQGFPQGSDAWTKLTEWVQQAALDNQLPVREEAIRSALKYLDQYCTYWASRAKPRVVATEYALSGSIPGVISPRTARLDDIGEYPEANYKLCIGECKTTSVSVNDVVQEYTLHGQTALQRTLWYESPEGFAKHGPVEFILLDIIVKGFGKDKCTFGRQPVRVSDYTTRWFVKSLGGAVSAMETMTKESPVERRVTSCTRQIGRMRVDCEFKSLCAQGQSAALGYVDAKGESLGSAKYRSEPVKPWD